MRKKVYWAIAFTIITVLLILMMYHTIPRLEYQYDEALNTYAVKKAYGNSREYKIKSFYKGLEVTDILPNAFNDHSRLQIITFEDNPQLKRIGRKSFANCPSLTSITIPNSVEYIEQNAFLNNVNLRNVYFEADSKLKFLGGSTFFNCDIREIVLPTSLLEIGTYCFFNNKNLVEITLPRDLKEIYSEVFYGCSSLTTIYDKTLNCSFDKNWLGGTNENIQIIKVTDNVFQN